MTRPTNRVLWRAPRRPAAAPIPEGLEASPQARRRGELEALIATVGVPVVEGATTAREWAVTLLQLAAEIEHALMVQYLYAGASVPDDTAGDGINYREKIVDVAIQEMGHLATVENILLLLGGPAAVTLQRDVLRRSSDMNAIPFVLEPATKTALAKFVAAERPLDVPQTMQNKVAELVAIAEQDAGIALKRVGVIYALLRWMFAGPSGQPDEPDFAALVPLPAEPWLTDADLQAPAAIAPFLATRAEWGINESDILLFAPTTRADAVAALDDIAAQGEGLLSDDDRSHFEVFMEIVAACEQGHVAAQTLATSPALGPHAADRPTNIDHPYTRLWGEAFALQYTLVVVTIQDAFRTARADDDSAGMRDRLAGDAVRRMRRVIDEVGALLATMPLHPAGDALSGPPYDLDPAILEQSDPIAARHLSLLDQLEQTYVAIAHRPEFAADPEHANRLDNLRNEDRRHRKLFA